MPNQVDTRAAFRSDELLSITRNPVPGAKAKARRDTFDAALVIPCPVDPNWFAATWYSELPERPGIGAWILRLAAALNEVRIHLSARAGRPVLTTVWQGQSR